MTITLTREEAQLLWEALESASQYDDFSFEMKTLRARLSAPEPSIVEDAIVYGTGITMGGNRIDPASIYKEPEPPCKTGSQCIGGKCPQCVVSEPEPVAWFTEDHREDKSATTYSKKMAERWKEKGWPVTPLYTAPPQRKWQGLTDEDIRKLFRQSKQPSGAVAQSSEQIFARNCRATEAKLKEKNNDLP
jgi:hypothetical protein